MANPLTSIINTLFGTLLPGSTSTGAITGAANSISTDVSNDVSSWLKSAAGQIGSGIESGFIAAIRDVWTVIAGPLEVIAGALLIIIVLVFMFRDDLMQAGSMFGFAAAA